MSETNKTDVFQFMSVRAPQSIDSKTLRLCYIQDDDIPQAEKSHKKLRNVFSLNSGSALGKILYQKIFCDNSGKSAGQLNEDIIQAVLSLVESKSALCEVGNYTSDDLVNELESRPYFYQDYQYYLLPEKLEFIEADFDWKKLHKVRKVLLEQSESFDRKDLFKDLKKILDIDSIDKFVFSPKGLYDPQFQSIKNSLFETLYMLYILRRKTAVNLEEIIQALQVLHVLEYLAVDEFLSQVYEKEIDVKAGAAKIHFIFFKDVYPEIAELNLRSATHFYYIKNKHDLKNFLDAMPIIHPIVAELAWYGKGKFNSIKPYLGDLKVVKQWLSGYKVGEISHIHNIMKSEVKVRDFRHLEKTEDVFSVSSSSSQNTQTESQSTDRFELKKEVERVIKTDINVGANVNMTYKYGDVFTASLGTNLAYANSVQDSQRLTSNYAREVMSKALTNIQSSRSEQRSVTKIYETEEKNTHRFENTQSGAQHISGIYRWLDKKYKAQLYNYGQRWMFEFVIPEPAAFYVKAKLKAAEFDIQIPTRPEKKFVTLSAISNPVDSQTPLQPGGITEEAFNLLRLQYDLAEFSFPQEAFWVPFTDVQRGNNNLAIDVGGNGNGVWTNNQFRTVIPKGYDVSQFSIVGNVQFYGAADLVGEDWHTNKLLFMLNGNKIKDVRDRSLEVNPEYKNVDEHIVFTAPIAIHDGEVILDLNIQDLHQFSVMIYLYLTINNRYLLDWKTQIFNKIQSVEIKKVEKINQDFELEYNTQLSDYQNKMDSLNAQVVNDIIQGRSEAFNSQIIRDELKKHCIAMIAKEFDLDNSDDLLSNKDALGPVGVNIEYEKFEIGEETAMGYHLDEVENAPTVSVARFIVIHESVDYPKIDLTAAAKKARYIQFLEQAFEWGNIAYIFYPYFWAHESKWIKLMNRLDYTDNNMTAFLKAGSSRVLLAVTPGYKDAVMHFLATREPWEGGALPVIGDPLFIPIYEEIRKQQDNLRDAVAEGTPWDFEIPTSLVYLQDSSSPIPEDLQAD
jgi:hypothetical protein